MGIEIADLLAGEVPGESWGHCCENKGVGSSFEDIAGPGVSQSGLWHGDY